MESDSDILKGQSPLLHACPQKRPFYFLLPSLNGFFGCTSTTVSQIGAVCNTWCTTQTNEATCATTLSIFPSHLFQAFRPAGHPPYLPSTFLAAWCLPNAMLRDPMGEGILRGWVQELPPVCFPADSKLVNLPPPRQGQEVWVLHVFLQIPNGFTRPSARGKARWG